MGLELPVTQLLLQGHRGKPLTPSLLLAASGLNQQLLSPVEYSLTEKGFLEAKRHTRINKSGNFFPAL